LSPLVIYIASTLALASTVTIDGETWRALQPPETVEEKAPAPMVVDRAVRLEKVGEELHLVSRWWINAPKPGWFHAKVAGPSVLEATLSYNGRKVPVNAEQGGVWITEHLTSSGVLELRGVLAIGEPTTLNLLAPAHGRVEVIAEGLDVQLSGDGSPVLEVDEFFWTGAERLTVELHEPRAAVRNDSLLAKGRVGLGLTVGEAEVVGRAHLEWRITRGQMSQVSFSAKGLGADLAVEGPAVGSWRRQGNQVQVTLREAVEGLVSLDLSWTTPLPTDEEDQVLLPQIRLDQTFSSESALQLARDGDLEVLPDLPGWQPIAATALPDWGLGLVAGTPSAAYTSSVRETKGALSTLRFTPVSGPATLIDVAAYTIALTELGRSLTRAHLSVRNDRGSHLRVVPPPGVIPLGVRVANQVVTPVSDGNRGWLIPLTRSVETVDGLLSFSVEIIFLGESTLWDKRVDRRVLFPAFDAPVAASRVNLHLPPGFESRMEEGTADVVDEFSEGEGITYGLAAGDAKVAEADSLFQEAVSAWVRNDFDAVQSNLDELRSIGADNKNMQRLQANVDLVLAPTTKTTAAAPKSGSSGRVALERRIKEQARARADKDVQRQEIMLEEAEEAYLAGDYEKAEATYNEALDIGGMLEKLEQAESVETKSQNVAINVRLETISKKKKQKEKMNQMATIVDDLDDDAFIVQFGRDAEPEWLDTESAPPRKSVKGRGGAGRVGGLRGTKGVQSGSGGLGIRGSGSGGGGSGWSVGVGGMGVEGVAYGEGKAVSGTSSIIGSGVGASAYGWGDSTATTGVEIEFDDSVDVPDRNYYAPEDAGSAQGVGKGSSGYGYGAGSISESKKAVRGVKYKERVEIDFGDLDDVNVTGELIKPQGQLILDRKRSGQIHETVTTLEHLAEAEPEPSALYQTRSEFDFEGIEVSGQLAMPEPELNHFASDDASSPDEQILYKSRTEIDFDGIEISGELVMPEEEPAPTAAASEPMWRSAPPRREYQPVILGHAKRPLPPPPAATQEREAINVFGATPVVVTATALSVIVPTQGKRIRYQHLLLPAETPLSVAVRAKKTRRE
jgi:hypothetical protein